MIYRKVDGTNAVELVKDDKAARRLDNARTDHDNVMARLARLTQRVRREKSEIIQLRKDCIGVNKKWD